MIYRGQAFCGLMIRLLAHPLPPLLSASCLSFSVFLRVAGPAYWPEGGGGADETNHTTTRKSGPLEITQYSLLYLLPVSERHVCGMMGLSILSTKEYTRSGSREVASRWMSNDLSNDGSSEDPCPVISDSLGCGGGEAWTAFNTRPIERNNMAGAHTHFIFLHFFQ